MGKLMKGSALLIALMMIFASFVPVHAISKSQMPIETEKYVYLANAGNRIMRVGASENKKQVYIEYCDPQMRVQERKTIAMELPVWGGFYEGSDAYYLVEGQTNYKDQKNVEVFRAIKYDKNWNRLASGSMMSNEIDNDTFSYTSNPFDLDELDLTEVNGHLILATAHQAFTDPAVGQGHTGLYLASFRESDMKARLIAYNLWHSFVQFVRYDGNYLYLLQQSEGSRRTALTRYNQKFLERMDRPYGEKKRYFAEDEKPESFTILQYGGERTSVWSIDCHASVDGMELSPDTILTAGSTIDQSRYKENVPYNVYVSVTPKASFNQEATVMHYLTNNQDTNTSYRNITMSKINDNRYIVSWVEDKGSGGSALQYTILDANGNTVVNTQSLPGMDYDEKPIVVNGQLLYHDLMDKNIEQVAYVNSETGAAQMYRYSLSGKNMMTRLSGHTLTIWCQSEDLPFSYSHDYNEKDITEMVIQKSFDYKTDYDLEHLTKITVEDGTSTFDMSCFTHCYELKKIYLPKSVKKIKAPRRSHIASSPTVVAEKGSYAIKWANRYGFDFQEVKAKKAKKTAFSVTYKNYHKIKVSVPKQAGVTQYQFALNKKNVQKSKANSYTSKTLKDGHTYKIQVRAYKNKKCVKTWKTSVTILKKTTLSKGKKNQLNWKKVKGASGYEVATSTQAKKGFKVKKVKGTSLKLSGKVYVKVRPYVKTKSQTIYGPFSVVKHI